MYSENRTIIIKDAAIVQGVYGDKIVFRDETGVKFALTMKLLLRLYSIAKFEVESVHGLDWDKFTAEIFEEKNNAN